MNVKGQSKVRWNFFVVVLCLNVNFFGRPGLTIFVCQNDIQNDRQNALAVKHCAQKVASHCLTVSS